MKKSLILILFLALFFVTGCSEEANFLKPQPRPATPSTSTPSTPVSTSTPIACTMEAKICPDGSAVGRSGPNCEFTACPAANDLTYENNQYGFALTLSPGWQGYSVSTTSIDFGLKITIRHPKWTKTNPYEDIPILIYSLSQWQKWEANNFENYPTAAPFGPQERGRNSSYVFATAPRYNYDFQTGWEEVENIIKTLITKPIVSTKL